MSEKIVFFLQNNPDEGPAQTALAQLFANEKIRSFHPVLLTNNEGWLTNVCEQFNIPFLIAHFPNPLSFLGRLRRNKWFACEIRRLLRHQHPGWKPSLIIANNLEETRLAIKLGQQLKAPRTVILRPSKMTRDEYEKNLCRRCAAIFVASEELKQQIALWNPSKLVCALDDLPTFLIAR